MELALYQVAILLTTLFSGSDTRPEPSRQPSVIRFQSAENQSSSQLQNEQGNTSSRHTIPPEVENSVHKSSILAVRNMAIRNRKRRLRRYVLQGSRLYPTRAGMLTWKYDLNYQCRHLSDAEVVRTLDKAFRQWSEVTKFYFRQVPEWQWSDVTVRFAINYHGDPHAFDGHGGILAHAFYPNVPQWKGHIHFDNDDSWTEDKLLSVGVHEIGHALGLKHSLVPGSVMTPIYNNLKYKELARDDVDGIKAIYGYCKPKNVSAIDTWMYDGKTYVLKEDRFWRMNDQLGESDRGYPEFINKLWNGIPNNIDEVFTWGHNSKFYFFQGSQYYRYNDQLKKPDWFYPLTVSRGWPGLPANGIDAGLTHSNARSYFFKGTKVYLWNDINDRVEWSWRYGKQISQIWRGIPDNLDSAFRWYWDGKTYFFKDDHYYIWDTKANGPYLIGNLTFKNICEV